MIITRFAFVALALLSSLPASAGEHYRHGHYSGEVLNGRLHTYDFDGGVGQNAQYGSYDYGGGAYAGGGGMMYGYGSTSSASASAGASAAAGGATSWMYGYSR